MAVPVVPGTVPASVRRNKPRPVQGENASEKVPDKQKSRSALTSYVNQLIKTGRIKAAQQFLKAQGYDLALDGKMGPQTASARDAYRKGQSPESLAAWWRRKIAANQAATAREQAKANPVTRAQGGTKAPKGGVAGASTGGSLFGDLISQAMESLIDPGSYAAAGAGYEFDPLIADLQSQIDRAPGEAAMHQQNIADWYNQVEGRRAEMQGANDTVIQGTVNNQQSAVEGFINAIGGSSNPGSQGVAQQGSIDVAGLQGQGLATQTFDRDMAAVLALQGAESKVNQQRVDQMTLEDLRNELSGLKKGKGQLLTKLLGDAQETQFDQLGALQNMILGDYLAGPQVAGANLDNAYKAAQISQIGVLTEQEKERLRAFREDSGGGPDSQFSAMEPAAKTQLAQYLTQALLGPGGNFTVYPGTVANRIRQRMFGIAGYDQADPAAQQFVQSVITNTLTPGRISWWNKRYPNKKYRR